MGAAGFEPTRGQDPGRLGSGSSSWSADCAWIIIATAMAEAAMARRKISSKRSVPNAGDWWTWWPISLTRRYSQPRRTEPPMRFWPGPNSPGHSRWCLKGFLLATGCSSAFDSAKTFRLAKSPGSCASLRSSTLYRRLDKVLVALRTQLQVLGVERSATIIRKPRVPIRLV